MQNKWCRNVVCWSRICKKYYACQANVSVEQQEQSGPSSEIQVGTGARRHGQYEGHCSLKLSLLREIKAAKAFFRAGIKPFWHLISHLFHCYKTIGTFSSECFEISICTRLSCYIKNACIAFLGEVRFAANDHKAPSHVDFLLVLLRTTTGSLDGSSHFMAPFSQGLCHHKLSAAELGVLLNFTV